jgi:predicted Fe-Mo cluster-binding NifX family protein
MAPRIGYPGDEVVVVRCAGSGKSQSEQISRSPIASFLEVALMKIAVASNDGVSVSEHFGRTNRFVVFEVEDNTIVHEEHRNGIRLTDAMGICESQRGRNQAALDYSAILAALDDCRVILCRGMGWRAASALVRGGLNPLVIKGEVSPREAVEQYMNGTLQPASGFCRCQDKK